MHMVSREVSAAPRNQVSEPRDRRGLDSLSAYTSSKIHCFFPPDRPQSLLQSLKTSFLPPSLPPFELKPLARVIRREPTDEKVCVDLDSTRGYRPPRPPKGELKSRTCSSSFLSQSEGNNLITSSPVAKGLEESSGVTRMRLRSEEGEVGKSVPKDKMALRNEALMYWRSIHNKYSLLNDINKQRRSALVKKQKQRHKERNKMSVFFVFMFMALFLLILLVEIFFIDDRRKGSLLSGKANAPEFDPMAEIPDYLLDDKKLIGDIEIDTYRRQELSVKGKGANERSFFRKNVDETHLLARMGGSVMRAVRNRDQEEWLVNEKDFITFNANLTATDAQWMPVYNPHHKFYVYSAYYDDRKGRIIRIIGATQTKKSDKIWCKYWYSNSSSLIVNGIVKVIRENWNLKYSACFIACTLTVLKNGKQPIPPPESVSVMTDPGGNATNKLKVLNLDVDKDSSKDGLAVCVKPLHFDYNNVNQIVEFIELNRIMGVSHFTLYNHTIGSSVDCVLRRYIRENLVRILPWKLNIQSQKEIRTEGLFAALNDCLYRYMYQYRYVLMIDLDEYIVPHSVSFLPDLISFLRTKADERKIGAISFQNAFFYLQWPDDPSSAFLPPLVTLRKTHRRQRFHPHKQRSKYIAVSPYVVEAGNHFVWEFLPGHGTLNVPTDVAFLHHYRVCEFGGDDCIRNPRMTDTSMYRYKDPLVKAFASTMAHFSSVCGFDYANDTKEMEEIRGAE